MIQVFSTSAEDQDIDWLELCFILYWLWCYQGAYNDNGGGLYYTNCVQWMHWLTMPI